MAGIGVDNADTKLDFLRAPGHGGGQREGAGIEVILRNPGRREAKLLRRAHQFSQLLHRVMTQKTKAQVVNLCSICRHNTYSFNFCRIEFDYSQSI